jgi:hypothetical protein
LSSVRSTGDVGGSLARMFGDGAVASWLGPPNAVDLHARDGNPAGERWQWRNGGWQTLDVRPVPRSVSVHNGRIVWNNDPSTPSAAVLVLDDWSAYEREPRDNVAP